MITSNQINALTGEELGYLVICMANEWNNLGMPYQFKPYYIKWFRNDSIQHILNKYSPNLTDENKGIIIQILNKLEENK